MSAGFFDIQPDWREHWRGMPAFDQKDLAPFQTVQLHFYSEKDREAFAELIGQRITGRTRWVNYPFYKRADLKSANYKAAEHLNPGYPVYVISKGRWKSRLTSKVLERMDVPYRIVIEPQEQDEYAAVIDPKKILVLPFSNLGKGSIPARNWVWEHSVQEGHARHWILDDNIREFYRLTNNLKHRVLCGNIFKAAENFVDRYNNVALAGFNYELLIPRKVLIAPFIYNTRIYSCILIKNDLYRKGRRWRGRYNEDTDLSLRVLKDGWCTVQFNAFLADKQSTMSMKGGNTDELYVGEGRLEMAHSLEQQHPDCVKVVQKWGRWQHSVDYSRFRKNTLKLKGDIGNLSESDEYGMYLEQDEEEVGGGEC